MGGGELIIVQNINLPMRVDNPAYIFYTRKTIRGGDCPNSFRVQIQNHHKNKNYKLENDYTRHGGHLEEGHLQLMLST